LNMFDSLLLELKIRYRPKLVFKANPYEL